MTDSRTILGFKLAPLTPAVLLLWPIRYDVPMYVVGVLYVSGVVAYPTALLFGLPIYFLLKRLGWNGFLIYCAAGSFLGMIPFVVLEAIFGSTTSVPPFSLLSTANVGIPLGVSTAVAFWLIARPDKARPADDDAVVVVESSP